MGVGLVLRRTDMLPGGIVIEMVIWQLPAPTVERPHRLKYRLQAHRGGRTLVRYDNEAGKGDHRHVGGKDRPYVFSTPEQLIADFWRDADAWRP